MSKAKTASPSASAGGVGENTTDESTASGANESGDALVIGGNDAGDAAEGPEVVKEVSAAALEWAAALEYPVSTFLRNNGHVTVVEPVSAQIVGGGAVVPVTLHDQGHAIAVLDNTITLNGLHFNGALKVRLDAAPDDLYLKG